MGTYIARRLLQAAGLLSAMVVFGFHVFPIYYTAVQAVRPLSEYARGQIDQPIPLQYATWLGKFLTGDWGYSLVSHRPVLGLVAERLPNTILLMGTVFVVVVLLTIPIGALTAVRQYSLFDHVTTGATFAFLSTPTFWLGLLLIIVFGLELRWLPLGGMRTPGGSGVDLVDSARHLVLPVATIALVQLGSRVRYLRASMLETINQDYMRTARAKGLGEPAIVIGHALKNASIPLVTILALDLPELFAGALVTEQIFGWPGMGRLFWDSATRFDYPVLMGILAVTSTLIVLANLFADVVYAYLDPRIRYS